jgi:hypothetical protein
MTGTGRMRRTAAFRNGFVAAPPRPCVPVPGRKFPRPKGENVILDDPWHRLFHGAPATAQQGNRLVLGFSLALRGAEAPPRQPGYGGIYGELSWVSTLEEKDEGNTWLTLRTRANYGSRPYRALTMPILLAGGEVFTARKTLYGNLRSPPVGNQQSSRFGRMTLSRHERRFEC